MKSIYEYYPLSHSIAPPGIVVTKTARRVEGPELNFGWNLLFFFPFFSFFLFFFFFSFLFIYLFIYF